MKTAKMFHFYNGPKPYKIARDDAGIALVMWNNLLTDVEEFLAK